MAHWFTVAFVTALAAHLVLQLWLSSRQVRQVIARRDAVPASFADVVSLVEHQKAADYTVARQKFGRVEILYDAVILLGLTLGGGLQATADMVSAWQLEAPWDGVAHVLLVMLALAVLGLPCSLWRTFVLEQRFGFNRTTVRTFVVDLVKGLVLGGVLGLAVVATLLWVMDAAGRLWWVAAWATWMSFSLVLLWAWPRWIAGLFNRFTPLQDTALRERIDALLARCDFHARDVYVMDGSRRSAHGNAYFTGLGREKRIVFFDTLLTSLSPIQVEAVLAHELAHFKLRHIPQRLIVSGATSLAGFALLGWLARQDWFYQSLGVTGASDSAALLLFMLGLPVFTWVFTPLASAWSRKHEFEADAFAAKHSDGPELARALVSMYRDNASTLTPDPLHSAFYDSHPPPVARIARLVPPGPAAPLLVRTDPVAS
jgi:Zn-dependent protease with chaperone function